MESSITQLDKLLKASEVAEILNISRSLSYRLIQKGDIPSVQIGKAIRVRKEDLSNYIAENLSFPNRKEKVK